MNVRVPEKQIRPAQVAAVHPTANVDVLNINKVNNQR